MKGTPELVAQRPHAFRPSKVSGKSTCCCESGGQHRTLSACAAPAFMARAMYERFELGSCAYVERTNALRGVQLMAYNRKHVHSELIDAGGYLAHRLRGIC